MTTSEMPVIAELISRALRSRADDAALSEVRAEVAVLCATFPAY
jgi:glycine/serine hydroxymethyltransferase